jgi:CheY-like chemotaxis protein
VEPFKIAAALKGVIAQRLLRRLCPHCKVPSTDYPERLRKWVPEGAKIFKPVGCHECLTTGYRGRMAIMEVLVSDSEVERRIAQAESTDSISEAARNAGMRTLWESGVDHVLSGVTDLEELLRVVEPPLEASMALADLARIRAAHEAAHAPAPVAPPVKPTGGDRGVRIPTPRPSAAFLPAEVLELLDDANHAAGKATAIASRQTVLLVEDEEALRLVLRDLLEREGYTIVEAADGIQALDEIDRSAPDAIVLDLNLPRLDGYGVLSHIRARPATANLPVLVLTARADEDNEVRVFEIGANDFITKPFRPKALSARLKALLKR